MGFKENYDRDSDEIGSILAGPAGIGLAVLVVITLIVGVVLSV